MMTSSNGNIFRVTGHLCGEFTGHQQIPRIKASEADFDVFFDLRLNKRLSKQLWGWWFGMPSYPLWRHCNVKMSPYHYRDPHVKDYKNPLHLDVVDRYLHRMGDKTIPGEAPPSLESFYPPWVARIDLPQSRCCGFFVSFTNEHK